jgi:hypothetical protein
MAASGETVKLFLDSRRKDLRRIAAPRFSLSASWSTFFWLTSLLPSASPITSP